MIEQGTEITNEGNTKTIGELDNKNVIEAAEEVVFLAQTAVNIEKAVSKKKGLSFTDMLEKQEKMLDNEGAADVAQIGHDFGKAGVLAENPGIKVEWEIQTKHGAQRMAERGVTQEMVDSWVKNGKALKQARGRKYLFFTKEGAAVVGKDGYLVTVIPESDYDDAYKALSKSLFGK